MLTNLSTTFQESKILSLQSFCQLSMAFEIEKMQFDYSDQENRNHSKYFRQDGIQFPDLPVCTTVRGIRGLEKQRSMTM